MQEGKEQDLGLGPREGPGSPKLLLLPPQALPSEPLFSLELKWGGGTLFLPC